MCDCYKIGGPFIAEDPECEVHRKGSMSDQLDAANQRIKELEEENKNLHSLMVSAEQRATEKADEYYKAKLSSYTDLEKAAREIPPVYSDGEHKRLYDALAAIDKLKSAINPDALGEEE